ncbi:hypothetical protein [Sutcliffiella halmapala]|uniref:hypothetical protein n=1 Tax=Sutcliffiella halmapala TaxID=79882 RepID=UPI0014743799|nr:hypothetical protein [Sutcliffiella halmapala]
MKEYEQLQRENDYLKQLLVKMMHNQTSTEPSKIVTKKYSFDSNEYAGRVKHLV